MQPFLPSNFLPIFPQGQCKGGGGALSSARAKSRDAYRLDTNFRLR